MRGAEYSFAEDIVEIHKVCALLAGIAVLLTKNAQSMRRDDAFMGRVQLPFLEAQLESRFEFEPRMAYLGDTNEWIVYRLDKKTRMPVTELKAVGFRGCCDACLLFMLSVDS
jgi:hypothetical protein